MIVNREALNTLSTRIDQSQTMSFTRLEVEFGKPSVGRASPSNGGVGTVKVHFAIYQVVVRENRAGTWSQRFFDKLEVFGVIVVTLFSIN